MVLCRPVGVQFYSITVKVKNWYPGRDRLPLKTGISGKPVFAAAKLPNFIIYAINFIDYPL